MLKRDAAVKIRPDMESNPKPATAKATQSMKSSSIESQTVSTLFKLTSFKAVELIVYYVLLIYLFKRYLFGIFIRNFFYLIDLLIKFMFFVEKRHLNRLGNKEINFNSMIGSKQSDLLISIQFGFALIEYLLLAIFSCLNLVFLVIIFYTNYKYSRLILQQQQQQQQNSNNEVDLKKKFDLYVFLNGKFLLIQLIQIAIIGLKQFLNWHTLWEHRHSIKLNDLSFRMELCFYLIQLMLVAYFVVYFYRLQQLNKKKSNKMNSLSL